MSPQTGINTADVCREESVYDFHIMQQHQHESSTTMENTANNDNAAEIEEEIEDEMEIEEEIEEEEIEEELEDEAEHDEYIDDDSAWTRAVIEVAIFSEREDWTQARADSFKEWLARRANHRLLGAAPARLQGRYR